MRLTKAQIKLQYSMGFQLKMSSLKLEWKKTQLRQLKLEQVQVVNKEVTNNKSLETSAS